MVWNDEFEYNGKPDTTKWDFNLGGHGWGNKEWQYYTNNITNAGVQDGRLIITASEEMYKDSKYTSARLTTKSTGGYWRYGKIEARIKLPHGQGVWPAFWMMGINIKEVGWPACGEIDIMEMLGGKERENTTHGTLHWRNPAGLVIPILRQYSLKKWKSIMYAYISEGILIPYHIKKPPVS